MSDNDEQTTANEPRQSVLASLRAFIPQRDATFIEALRVAELQAHRLLIRFGITAAPVSDDLLLDLPRMTVEYVHAMPTSGCSFWAAEHRSWIIQINADEPATRQRFTAFHEYKHIIDHGRTSELYGSGPAALRRAEQAADYFAGCVLMPRSMLKRAWGYGVQSPDDLAQAFDVSAVAVSVRLAQTGLSDQPVRCTQVATATPSTPGRTSYRRPRQFPTYQRQSAHTHRVLLEIT
ncbi:MAG: ImmA/IrrE family metallo-endopeptidase [Nakamurella sp.]